MPDIVTGKTFVDGEKGITATKMNQIISQAVIQPSFVTSKPSSSTLDPTDQLLEVKGAGTYATITGSQLISSVSAQVDATPQIYSVRLRSFNAAGNPTFEVDQRNAGAPLLNPGSGFSLDRWQIAKAGTPMTVNTQQASLGTAVGGGALLPGTSFVISQYCLRITLTAQSTTLAAGDYLILQHFVEGSSWRELMGDVHSLQVLVRSSVAGLRFGVALNDGGTTLRSLTKLSPAGLVANVWTLVQWPNIPVWPSGGNFTSAPGANSYLLRIVLACGSNNTAAANDVWQNANVFGAVGQSNFAASPVNSNFDIAFVQHEPGAVCTTPIDCPFGQNLDGNMGCLRYYQKSYPYGVKSGTVNPNSRVFTSLMPVNFGAAWGAVRFPKVMAKTPTVTGYSGESGSINALRDLINNVDRTITGSQDPSDSGFNGFGISGQASTGNIMYAYHYTADTGW